MYKHLDNTIIKITKKNCNIMKNYSIASRRNGSSEPPGKMQENKYFLPHTHVVKP